MSKAKMIGMNKPFIPNSKADRLKNKQFFFHGKDAAEDYERIDRIFEKKLRKSIEKSPNCC